MSFPPDVGLSDRPLRGITFMVLGIAAFSVMDGLSKWLVMVAPIFEIMVLRNSLTLLLVVPMVARAGGVRALGTRRGWAHATRAGLSVVALLTFFEALRHLPLATCIAIGFAAPLFMTAASVVLLRERVGIHRWAAIVVGFLGVLVIAWPESGVISWPAALMIVSSLCFALSMITVRWLARTEGDAAMLFIRTSASRSRGSWGCRSSGRRRRSRTSSSSSRWR